TAEKDIRDLTSEFDRLMAEIRQKSPRYAAVTQPQPLTLKEIQRLLAPDTLLLEYQLGKERSFLWAVTQDSIKSYELPSRSEVEAAARNLYELLTARNKSYTSADEKRRKIAEADAEYPKAAMLLSRMALGRVEGELFKKRLLIVSDGAL